MSEVLSTETRFTLSRDLVSEYYEVTEDGRVFSVAHNWRGNERREMRQTPNSHGYPSVRLTLSGKRRHIAVHRLVALFYLPERPSSKHEVRHLDGNRENPRALNLAWGTPADNAKDRDAHGTTQRGQRHWKAKVSAEQVQAIRTLADGGASYVSISSQYGISARQVGYIATRRYWAHV